MTAHLAVAPPTSTIALFAVRTVDATDVTAIRLRTMRRPLQRLVAVLASAVTIAALGLALVATSVGADGPSPSYTHLVRSGDTLWALAAERTPAGGDVRETVAEIVARNDLPGADLRVGQRLDHPLAP